MRPIQLPEVFQELMRRHVRPTMASQRSERSAPVAAQRRANSAVAPGDTGGVNAEQHAANARRDADLMARACNGDRHAYGQLAQRLGDRMFNAMLRIIGDPEEARELTQETFTRGLARLDSFRGEAGPYTWLFRIGMNLAISQLRKVDRRRPFSLDGAMPGRDGADGRRGAPIMRLASSGDSPLEDLERRERAQQVVAAMGRLDPEYRAALVMRDIEGFDYQTMADALSLPLGTLKSRLFRARLALRDELAPYLKDPAKSGGDESGRPPASVSPTINPMEPT
jgi:RNA polymerase sigma-70 factor, ECF subfamily